MTKEKIKRTQKAICKLIFQNNFETYEKCLEQLNIEKLSERRKSLSLKFAKDSIENGTLTDLLKEKKIKHKMIKRNTTKYHIQHANTNRLQKSGIVYLQSLLNEE